MDPDTTVKKHPNRSGQSRLNGSRSGRCRSRLGLTGCDRQEKSGSESNRLIGQSSKTESVPTVRKIRIRVQQLRNPGPNVMNKRILIRQSRKIVSGYNSQEIRIQIRHLKIHYKKLFDFMMF